MPEEKGIQDTFEAQLIELCAKYPRRENQLAEDLGISFGWFSKVKNGATPSRALVSAVARLHKQCFSSSVQELREEAPRYGAMHVDLPPETLELAQQQVDNGRFRDVREYLVHLVSRDARESGNEDAKRRRIPLVDHGVSLTDGPDTHTPPKKRNQKPKSTGKHGGN